MGIENVSGHLSLLRVHKRGSKFGPANDQIDVEVIAQIASRPTSSTACSFAPAATCRRTKACWACCATGSTITGS